MAETAGLATGSRIGSAGSNGITSVRPVGLSPTCKPKSVWSRSRLTADLARADGQTMRKGFVADTTPELWFGDGRDPSLRASKPRYPYRQRTLGRPIVPFIFRRAHNVHHFSLTPASSRPGKGFRTPPR